MKHFGTIAILIFCLTNSVDAQNVQFRKLTSNQGLSHNTVYAISQDEKGEMWFATREGLNRYDSYQIKNYYIKDTIPGGSADKISSLLCNKDEIYIGTEDGMYVFNQRTDHISRSPVFRKRLSILFLFKDANNTFIGTSAGLYKIADNKVRLISSDNVPARAMGKLSENSFLVSLGNGLKIINDNGEVQKTFNTRVSPNSVLSTSEVFNIYKDGTEFLWLSTNHGLFCFDIKKQQFSKLNFSKSNSREANTVRAVAGNGRDILYIGTEDGLYAYNMKTGKSENYQQSFGHDPKKLNDKAIYSAYMARDGSLWFGTYFGGVNYIPYNTYGFESIVPLDNGKGLSGKAISQMMEDRNQNIWIGTEDGGITIYNPEKDFYSYINKSSRPFYLNINNVHAIHDDGYGNIWVGTFLGGLHRFDIKNQKTTIYTNKANDKSSLSNDNVYAIYRDSKGKLWIGTQNGLNIFDYTKEKFSLFKPDVLGNRFIYDMTEDQDGNLWFCTRFNGIYRYDPSSGHIDHYTASGNHPVLTSDQVISVYKDSRKHLWFGTLGGGVCVFDIEKKKFRNYTTADGLPNDNVYGILEDKNGHIWLTTNRGLSEYDFAENRFINFSNKYRLPSNQFNFKSYLRSSNGTLFFGSINGLCFFHPEKISSPHPLIPLIFTDFQLFNKSVIPSQASFLKNQIDYARQITLSYKQNVFTINYTAINYANPGSTDYAYYLEGFEDRWNYVRGKNSVTYTNLSPGNYTFHVMAVQANGTAQSIERTIGITVTPPFYRTKTAYLVYLLVISLLVWLYSRFIKFLHQKKLEVQIERIEKEKTKELTQNRLNFFTFISHEFKTPLTLILASIEKFTEEKGAGFKQNSELTSIKNNASILFKLIQQLMEFRKIETQHDSIELTFSDLVSFLKDITFNFKTIAINKNIEVEFQSEKVTMPCYFDKDKVEKIVFNIISNAIKNTNAGKITVCINFEKKDKSDETVIIKISDTGKGMTGRELKNIFNPFYKSPESTQGSGIGLALVNSLTQYLGGEIKVTSEQHKGTQVAVALPILLKPIPLPANEKKPEQNKTDLTLDSPATNPTVPKKMNKSIETKYTLLIVEDNRELLTFLSNHFSKTYNICTSSNGLAALKKINKTPPDIIISDVKMPKMDGLELCRQIKSDASLSYIPLILLSELGSQDIRIDGLHIGADAYLNKPFNLKELELLVSNMIDSRVKLRKHVINIRELAFGNLPDNNKNQEFLIKITDVLEKSFSDCDLTIEDLARHLNMSRTSLHLNLKKNLNKSASDLLNEYRLRRAAIMLRNDMPINETAYACGYRDPNYFSRVFKKYYGKSPYLFSKNKKEDAEIR